MNGLLRAMDIFIAALAWVAAYGLRVWASRQGWTTYLPPTVHDFYHYGLICLILCPLVFGRTGLYTPKRTHSLGSELWMMTRAVLVVWTMVYIIISLIRQADFSRLMMVSVLGSWIVLAGINRLVVRATLHTLRRHGRNQRSAAIIGAGRLGQRLYETIRHNPWTGIMPVYFMDDHCQNRMIRGLPVYGPTSQCRRILEQHPVDIVFLAPSRLSQEEIENVADELSSTSIDLRLVPNLLSVQFLRHGISQLDDLTIISLTDSPQQGWNSLFKSVLDVSGALFCLLIGAIPMLLIAVAIKLNSPGPIFYRQWRVSIGGQPFKIFKFRTMRVDAESESGPVWAIPGDDRVTSLGRFLRRTSLDELPQFFNVLKGEMSLVGPRPERPELIEGFKHEIPRYMLRHHVKAGITGWAQVNGLRGQTSLRKRIQYDLYYVKHWSSWLDVKILFLTVFISFVRRDAY